MEDARRFGVVLRWAMFAAAATLAVIELWRTWFDVSTSVFLFAVGLTAVWLPLHLWHLAAGVRGERPVAWQWSLLVLAGTQVAGVLVVGVPWALNLAALVVSASVLLRPAPAVMVLVLAVLAAAWTGLRVPSDAVVHAFPSYLAVTVVFRSVLQASLVWLAGALERLGRAQERAVSTAVEQQRDWLRAALAERLTDRLTRLVDSAAPLDQREARGPEMLGVIARTARDLLAEVRRLSSDLRADGRPAAAAPAAPPPRSLLSAGADTVGRARTVHLTVDVVAVGFPLLLTLGLGDGTLVGPLPASVVVLLWLVQFGAYRYLSVSYAQGPRRQRARWVAVVASVGVAGAMVIIGWSWAYTGWTACAAVGLLLGRRAALLSSLLAIPAMVALVITDAPVPPSGFAEVLFAAGYLGPTDAMAVAALLAAAGLVRSVARLESLERWTQEAAASNEQRRLAAEMHDLLGQGLSALALRCDLAQRLAGQGDADRNRVQEEADEVLRLAGEQTANLHALLHLQVRVSCADEVRTGATLMSDLQIHTTARVDLPDALEEATDRLAGLTVREATTNVLRHSAASWCSIDVSTRDGALTIAVTNDGAAVTRDGSGTGLAGLHERLDALGGTLHTQQTAGEYRLTAALPLVRTLQEPAMGPAR